MSPSFPRPAPAGSSGDGADPHTRPPGRLGYNGQLHEPVGWWQFLGNGYRVYNPVLMRFHSPDSVSPFGKGGMNAYAYCMCDPVNRADPDGHWSFSTLFATLVPFKLKAMPAAAALTATATSLGFAGVAVSTKDDTQRGLVIAASVIAAAGALVAGRYAWVKSKPRVAMGNPAAPASIPPTPITGTAAGTPSTNTTSASPLSLASPASPATPPPLTSFATPPSQQRRPNVLAIPQQSSGPVLNRGSFSPPSAARVPREPQRAPVKMHVARIRYGSTHWHRVGP